MAIRSVYDSSLTALADAIRAKGGTSDPLVFPEGFANAVEEIQTGGGDDTLYQLISNTLTEFEWSGETAILSGKFYNNSNLKALKINATKSITLAASSIYGSGIEELTIHLNAISTTFGISPDGLRGATSLKIIDLKNCASISQRAFSGNSNFNTLILRRNAVVSFYNLTTFDNTPFYTGGTGGRCFVPAELISDYQAATNWAVFYEDGTCEFLPLEDYTVDGTIYGEIDWDKINALDAEGDSE